jgi:hypothetical protein
MIFVFFFKLGGKFICTALRQKKDQSPQYFLEAINLPFELVAGL